MEQDTRFETRYFGTRTGDVALTCCTRCGSIVWNPELHERAYHVDQGTIIHTHEATDEIDSGATQVDSATREALDANGTDVAVEDRSGGSEPVGFGRSTPTDRPVSSPPARGTGRATAAGSGRKGSR